MHVYTTRDLQRLLGVGESSLRTLIRAGHVRPRKGARGRLQFTFQDLIILRTAHSLGSANVPARRLNRCLRQLREALPSDVPLSGLSITAVGDQVAVREGRQHWDSESRQYLLALDVTVESGEVQVLSRTGREPSARAGSAAAAGQARAGAASVAQSSPGNQATGADTNDPGADYDAAYDLEDTDPEAAIAAYRRCLAADREHHQARLNCGRLLHLAGEHAAAEQIYREAAEPDASLLFNLAVLLEDTGRESQAMVLYRQALELDPDLADAHFNLARLHEQAGNQRESFRHLLAYKRSSE